MRENSYRPSVWPGCHFSTPAGLARQAVSSCGLGCCRPVVPSLSGTRDWLWGRQFFQGCGWWGGAELKGASLTAWFLTGWSEALELGTPAVGSTLRGGSYPTLVPREGDGKSPGLGCPGVLDPSTWYMVLLGAAMCCFAEQFVSWGTLLHIVFCARGYEC